MPQPTQPSPALQPTQPSPAPQPGSSAPALPPVTGPAHRWALDAALVGALTGYLGPALSLFGIGLHPWLLACTATGALYGALLGVLAPTLLEWMRPRASLYTITAVVPLLGFVLGGPLAALAAAYIHAPILLAAVFGALASGVQLSVFFVPYLVQVVRRQPRWPVLVAASLMATVLGGIARGIVVGGLTMAMATTWVVGLAALVGIAAVFVWPRMRASAPQLTAGGSRRA